MSEKIKVARFNHLDVYKGIGIVFIIITHFTWADPIRKRLFFPFWIDMAVPMFMAITGYVSCLSFERRGLSFLSCYAPKEIVKKWLRFIVPFFPIWMLIIIARVVVRNESFSIVQILLDFIGGGIGPGSYYIPVMLQVVLIMPIIWAMMKRKPVRGIVGCFSVNLVFEIIKTLIGLSPQVYRICMLRYLFILGFGGFLYLQKRECKDRKWYYTVGFIGIIYIILFNYTELKPPITNLWTSTSVFAVMFIVPLMGILIDKREIHNTVLETLGKASFDIFLVQMLFYLSGYEFVNKFVPLIPLRMIVIITICCVGGSLLQNRINNIENYS